MKHMGLRSLLMNGLKAVGLTAAARYLLTIQMRDRSGTWAKPIPALALAGCVLADRVDGYSGLVAAGLVASAAGDYYLDQGEEAFLKGVGSFFVAHVLYIAAYERDGGQQAALRAALAYGAVLLAMREIWGKLPANLKPGIAAYATAIATMLWRSFARVRFGDGRMDRVWGALGAASFVGSDALIGLTRFSNDTRRRTRYSIMLSYWLGQCGIAASSMCRPKAHT
jgi:alkenylglycerophosphocholine/alkenylglycerophosphoethanolamine hydrolase